MKFSEKIEKMHYSPIRKLVPYLEEATNNGTKVYELHIGQPNIKTPDTFFDGLHEYKDNIVKYANSRGMDCLIQEFIQFYANLGIDLNKDDILITHGGSEALTFAVMATCNKDDEILVLEPFYSNYDSFLKMSDANLVPIKLKFENEYKLPSFEELEALITSKTKAILFSNPNNPLGTVLTEDEMKAICELAVKHNLFIIADEVYRTFIFEDVFYKSFMNMEEVKDRVILVDSISKHYSACGARIGVIASKNKELTNLVLKLCQARLSVSTIEQVATTKLLNTMESYLDDVVDKYKYRRDAMCAGLAEIDGVEFIKPKSAFYVFAKLPVDDTDRFAKWLLTDFSYDNETLSFAPGSGFYTDGVTGKNLARFSFCASKTEDIKKGMALLKIALDEYNNI